LKGNVKRWLDGRGYGFIQPEGSEDDVFVHHSGLISVYELSEGQEVEFEVEDTPRGPRAVDVKVL
jgi:CspA family cold shock protein